MPLPPQYFTGNTMTSILVVHVHSCMVLYYENCQEELLSILLKNKIYIPKNFYTAHVQLSCHMTAWVSCWMSYHIFICMLRMHIQSKSLICKALSISTFICYSWAGMFSLNEQMPFIHCSRIYILWLSDSLIS